MADEKQVVVARHTGGKAVQVIHSRGQEQVDFCKLCCQPEFETHLYHTPLCIRTRRLEDLVKELTEGTKPI